ncbi:dTDP-3-amino-3,6-dideoxy-alpha-D-galactopyranose transaminase [compost metagenome]
MIEYENVNKLNSILLERYQVVFSDVLKSGWFINGPSVKKFEEQFAEYCSVRYCAGVANGLDALTIGLKVLNLPAGSEVIVPSNTYIATILSILQNNLVPILVEPDISTYNIDPLLIEEKISKKTKAIMVVHLYGKSCQMDSILSFCEKYNLFLIEDCAQAHGSTFKGKKVGSFGDIGAFSFYPTKNLGALGDAGAITTNDSVLMESVKTYRNYGSNVKYKNEVVGVNSRLDEIQAAFLIEKLKILDRINTHKRKLANIYLENLKSDFIKPVVNDEIYDVWHIFNVRHPSRDSLRQYLLDNKIGTEIHYPTSPNKQIAMTGILDKVECPISEEIHRTTLSLPISFFHSEDDIFRVVEVMNKF